MRPYSLSSTVSNPILILGDISWYWLVGWLVSHSRLFNYSASQSELTHDDYNNKGGRDTRSLHITIHSASPFLPCPQRKTQSHTAFLIYIPLPCLANMFLPPPSHRSRFLYHYMAPNALVLNSKFLPHKN